MLGYPLGDRLDFHAWTWRSVDAHSTRPLSFRGHALESADFNATPPLVMAVDRWHRRIFGEDRR